MVDAVLDRIRDALAGHEDVKLSGFGHFMVRHKQRRRGRNPKTGETIMIEPRTVVTFRASPLLKQKINRGGD